MAYLLANYWLWMLLALILGGIVAFLTFQRPALGGWQDALPGWFKLLCLLFVIGLVVALLKLLSDPAGHYLETALILVGSYIVGSLVGSWLASFRAVEPETLTEPAAVQASTPAPLATVPAAAPAAPAPVVSLTGTDGHPGRRPPAEARGDLPDNLKRIAGIGHTNEEKLNELGIWYFRQVAAWSHENVEWVGSYMAFPGRIEREHWVDQAGQLARGLETEFSRRVDHGDVPSSQ
jgi:predicted flap endonuclease-1-like 5' DNA nuclease